MQGPEAGVHPHGWWPSVSINIKVTFMFLVGDFSICSGKVIKFNCGEMVELYMLN